MSVGLYKINSERKKKCTNEVCLFRVQQCKVGVFTRGPWKCSLLFINTQFSGVYRCAEASTLWCSPKVNFMVARMVKVAAVCMVCCLLKLAWRILLLRFLPWPALAAQKGWSAEWAEMEVSNLPLLYCKYLCQSKLFLPKDSWVNFPSPGKKKPEVL